MLDTIRKKTSNLAFTLLVFLIVAVMAMFGVGQLGNQKTGGGAPVAWVNGEIITKAEFQEELQGRLRQYQAILGAQYDEKLILSLQLPQQILEQLIRDKLLSQQAKKMEIYVPDTELANHIRNLPYFQIDGKFSAELYRRMPNKGFEEQRQRDRLEVVKLQNYLQGRIRLTPADIKQAFRLNETRVNLAYAEIDFTALSSNHRPSAQQITKTLSSTPQEQIQQYYTSHQNDFTTQAQVQLRQIRVGFPYQATADKKEAAKKKIESVAKEINADNFAKIAKKHSDDEYAKKGGNRGWLTQGKLSPPLERAVAGLSPGQTSAPIETLAGFFILHVVAKKDKTVLPLDQVKRQIGENLATKAYKKKFQEDKLARWNKMLASGRTIEPELKRLKVKIVKTGLFPVGKGALPKMQEADVLLDAAFEIASVPGVSQRLYPHKNKYYFIKMLSLEKPKSKTFETKWSEIEQSSQSKLQNEFFFQWITALSEKAIIKREIEFDENTLRRL